MVSLARSLRTKCGTTDFRHLKDLGESTLLQLYQMRKSKQSRGLPALLRKYGHTCCENLQDRVLGLISLVNDPRDPLFAEKSRSIIKSRRSSTESISFFTRNRKKIIDYSLTLYELFRRSLDMYPGLPAHAFALPLWHAFDQDYHSFGASDYRQRVRIQAFPCSLPTLSKTRSRPLASSASRVDLTENTHEVVFCLADPEDRSSRRSARVALSVRVDPTSMHLTSQSALHTYMCWVESRHLALGKTGYDFLCKSFNGTQIYKSNHENEADVTWFAHITLASMKALHAITYPHACERLFDAMSEDMFNRQDLDQDLEQWVEAVLVLETQPVQDELTNHTEPAEATSNGPPTYTSAIAPKANLQGGHDHSRNKMRHKMVRAIHLTAVYDFLSKPLYGSRKPAWESA